MKEGFSWIRRCPRPRKSFASGIRLYAPDAAYNISRADLAVDFLTPDFVLSPDQFVMHSRTSRKTFDLIADIETNGRSSRTTSVTAGKMPNRQAILYDKREEVLARGKIQWPAIWAKTLYGTHAKPLDLSNRKIAQIWRIDIRAAKRHLKDTWGIKGWESFYALLPEVFGTLFQDIRYCDRQPTKTDPDGQHTPCGALLKTLLIQNYSILSRIADLGAIRSELLFSAFGVIFN